MEDYQIEKEDQNEVVEKEQQTYSVYKIELIVTID